MEKNMLKKCPFCHGFNVRPSHISKLVASFWVQCDDCFACGPQKDSEAEAIEAWNRCKG